MTQAALLAWENRQVSSLYRSSDRAEATADERQDLVTSLNFPLHWTSAAESWNYLFDIAVACALLAPRPDDRVLDLASGTGWATELLLRLGVRPVAIDLSVEMMRRGRQRLVADERLALRNDAAFVAGRGQMLPFADETFDGVLCLNALHHLPSYGDALREVYRVLKPGGRAVFSEPGTAHAAGPLSQFRMREESVIEKSVSLPLIRRLAADAGFTRMRVVPLRSAAEYAFDYSATDSDADGLRRIWDDTLRHAATEHARFALHKGDDPPADTLLPADRLTGRLAAHISPVAVAATVRRTERFTDALRIISTGSVTWKARGRRIGGQVSCGLKVCTPRGEVLREDLGRTPLPHDVGPHETIDLGVTVDVDLAPGFYELRYDMVVEGVTWFEFQGSTCFRRQLQVTG
jgi:SAM-dependent methyltransferase